MTYNPTPSRKPVWPVLAACVVVVIGLVAAALFVGMSLQGSDDSASGESASTSATADEGTENTEETASDDNEDSEDVLGGDDTEDGKPADRDDPTSDAPEPTPADRDDPTSDAPEPTPGETATDSPSPQPTETASPEPEKKSPSADKVNSLGCGRAATIISTLTKKFEATICLTGSGSFVYHGKSDAIAGSISLDATLDEAAGEWIATNKNFEYVVDNENGHVTIRDRGSGEIYGSQSAIRFDSAA